MAQKTDSTEDKIAKATLILAATHPWADLTLDHIARKAKISRAQITARYTDTYAVLPLLVRHITARTVVEIGKASPQDSPRDRLFDAMMTRFDVLQTHRESLLNIVRAMRHDRRMGLALLPAQCQAMGDMLAAAGLPCSPLATAGLVGIYGFAIWAWVRDSTVDMAKTMSALDRGLRSAERLAGMVSARAKP